MRKREEKINMIFLLKKLLSDLYLVLASILEPFIKYIVIFSVSKRIAINKTDFGHLISNTKKEFRLSTLYLFESILLFSSLFSFAPSMTNNKIIQMLINTTDIHIIYIILIILLPAFFTHYALCILQKKYISPYASLSANFYWWGFNINIILIYIILSFCTSTIYVYIINNKVLTLIMLIISVILSLILFMYFIYNLFNIIIWFMTIHNIKLLTLISSALLGMFMYSLIVFFIEIIILGFNA